MGLYVAKRTVFFNLLTQNSIGIFRCSWHSIVPLISVENDDVEQSQNDQCNPLFFRIIRLTFAHNLVEAGTNYTTKSHLIIAV